MVYTKQLLMQDGSAIPSAFTLSGNNFVVASNTNLEVGPYDFKIKVTETKTGLISEELFFTVTVVCSSTITA
jgi:PBP1b-binding outer membrane lipoprotein LpoB